MTLSLAQTSFSAKRPSIVAKFTARGLRRVDPLCQMPKLCQTPRARVTPGAFASLQGLVPCATVTDNPEVAEQQTNGNTPRVDCSPLVPRGAALQKVVSRDSTREAFAYCHVTRMAVSGQRPGRVTHTQESAGADVTKEFMKRSSEEAVQLTPHTKGKPICDFARIFNLLQVLA